jgi:RimJ/RimL family protein N-acetyltransferase
VAADHGLSRVLADTTLDNIASQRTLIRAGFRLVSTDAELRRYEVLLKGSSARSRRSGIPPATSSAWWRR